MTKFEAYKRVNRAFKWMLRNEDKRWLVFKRIRDKYRPLVRQIEPSARIELCLNQMRGGGEVSVLTQMVFSGQLTPSSPNWENTDIAQLTK